ncbi:MAG: hypothetical protein P8078_09735, partial [bacterium]
MFIFLFSGCASINKSSYYTLGKESLENQEYDAAIQAFSRQLKQDINDLKSVRELGIAYYKKGE